jgi:dTMP kinase
MFIVLEGLDGAGTTTQTQLLAEALRSQGRTVITTREPSDGPLGTLLRQALNGRLRLPDGSPVRPETIALWFATDRTDHLASTVEPAVAAGTIVISDRYVLSSIAYQSVECDAVWVNAINRMARPADLTIFVDVPVDECVRRISERGRPRDSFENHTFLEKVYAGYHAGLNLSDQNVRMVDGFRPVDVVASDILAAVTAAMA